VTRGKTLWIAILSTFCLALGAGAVLYGCDDDSESGSSSGELAVAYDLIQLAHLADVDQNGLFIDFGTNAQNKYTVGDWQSGWLSRGREGNTTFALAGRRARVYFQADEQAELLVRVRLQSIGTLAVTPYLNNQELRSVFFNEDTAFQNVDIRVPAEHVRRGENYLLLAFGGAVERDGQEVSVAIDSIRVAPVTANLEAVTGGPTTAELRGAATVGGSERQALRMPAPTRMSFYAEIPQGAKLAFGVGAEEGTATASVDITPDEGARANLFTGAAGGEWSDQEIDLASYAGKVVRIDLSAQGSGRVAFSTPRIVAPQTERPSELRPAKNVVLVMIDTLRADKLRPFNPRTRVQTPIIDRLAQGGVVFERAQSTSNWTKPSIAAALTGLHANGHDTTSQEASLPAEALMISEHFKANGFTTGGFIANGYISDRFGFGQGWDQYVNYIRENRPRDAADVFQQAGTWMEQNKDRRFFLYVHTIDPHVPYDPPDRYLSMYDAHPYEGPVEPRRTPEILEDAKRNPPRVHLTERDGDRLRALHDGEISQHDFELGRFLERLAAAGLTEDTAIVIVSDHGEEFNEHSSWGHGHSVYQELLHVPLLVSYPGTIAQGRVPTIVSTVDVAPTLAELAGVPALPQAEGQSLVGMMYGERRPGPAITFSEWLEERRVATTARFKMIVRGNLTASLFDLERDPMETQQLELTARPIAARFLRIFHGQFLGSTDRSQWLEAEQGPGVNLRSSEAHMDDTLRQQLEAIGYAH
jgi:arylsulfatase A-like enzyme